MFYSTELLSVKSHSWLLRLDQGLRPKGSPAKITRVWTLPKHGILILWNNFNASRYVISPPEPLSLRLASNLMIGITRVYGQQCQIYYADIQTFWTRISLSEKAINAATATTSTKAAKETITHAAADNVSFTNDLLLSGILEDLLATPEDPRRISKSVSSRIPSLEPASGSVSLPFEGVDTLAGYGFDDLVPWGSSVETMEEFKHGLFSRGEVEVPADLPDQVQVKSVTAKKPRIKKMPDLKDLIDEETVLERDDLLLASGEGLIPKQTTWELDLYKFVNPSAISKKKAKNKIKPIPEEPQGLESGVFDWDMMEAPPLPMDGLTGSSSFIGGSPIPRSLGQASLGSRGYPGSLGSRDSRVASPMANMDWNVPTNTAHHENTMDFLG